MNHKVVDGLINPGESFVSQLDTMQFGGEEALCPITTTAAVALNEEDELRAYKLGKQKCSYNQVELVLNKTGSDGSLGQVAVTEASEVPVGDDVDKRFQECCLRYNIRVAGNTRLRVYVFLVFANPYGSALNHQGGIEYFWLPVVRSQCQKGCSGPILRGLQRFGRMPKRIAIAKEETNESWKEPRKLYVAIDEASNHVGQCCGTSRFRLLVAVYTEAQELLGSSISTSIRVLANNDAPHGAANFQLPCIMGDHMARNSEPVTPNEHIKRTPLRVLTLNSPMRQRTAGVHDKEAANDQENQPSQNDDTSRHVGQHVKLEPSISPCGGDTSSLKHTPSSWVKVDLDFARDSAASAHIGTPSMRTPGLPLPPQRSADLHAVKRLKVEVTPPRSRDLPPASEPLFLSPVPYQMNRTNVLLCQSPALPQESNRSLDISPDSSRTVTDTSSEQQLPPGGKSKKRPATALTNASNGKAEEAGEDVIMTPVAAEDQDTYVRKEHSLASLCLKFFRLYASQEGATVHLEDMANFLGVRKRRVYDIVNVLESVEVLQRRGKNEYVWLGVSSMADAFDKLRAEALKLSSEKLSALRHAHVANATFSSSTSGRGRRGGGGEVSAAVAAATAAAAAAAVAAGAGARAAVAGGRAEEGPDLPSSFCAATAAAAGVMSESPESDMPEFSTPDFQKDDAEEEGDGMEEIEIESSAKGSDTSAEPEVEGTVEGRSVPRREKSLRALSEKFVQVFLFNENQALHWNVVVEIILGIVPSSKAMQKRARRLYDIANILSALHLIEKVAPGDSPASSNKPLYRWLGRTAVERHLACLANGEEKGEQQQLPWQTLRAKFPGAGPPSAGLSCTPGKPRRASFGPAGRSLDHAQATEPATTPLSERRTASRSRPLPTPPKFPSLDFQEVLVTRVGLEPGGGGGGGGGRGAKRREREEEDREGASHGGEDGAGADSHRGEGGERGDEAEQERGDQATTGTPRQFLHKRLLISREGQLDRREPPRDQRGGEGATGREGGEEEEEEVELGLHLGVKRASVERSHGASDRPAPSAGPLQFQPSPARQAGISSTMQQINQLLAEHPRVRAVYDQGNAPGGTLPVRLTPGPHHRQAHHHFLQEGQQVSGHVRLEGRFRTFTNQHQQQPLSQPSRVCGPKSDDAVADAADLSRSGRPEEDSDAGVHLTLRIGPDEKHAGRGGGGQLTPLGRTDGSVRKYRREGEEVLMVPMRDGSMHSSSPRAGSRLAVISGGRLHALTGVPHRGSPVLSSRPKTGAAGPTAAAAAQKAGGYRGEFDSPSSAAGGGVDQQRLGKRSAQKSTVAHHAPLQSFFDVCSPAGPPSGSRAPRLASPSSYRPGQLLSGKSQASAPALVHCQISPAPNSRGACVCCGHPPETPAAPAPRRIEFPPAENAAPAPSHTAEAPFNPLYHLPDIFTPQQLAQLQQKNPAFLTTYVKYCTVLHQLFGAPSSSPTAVAAAPAAGGAILSPPAAAPFHHKSGPLPTDSPVTSRAATTSATAAAAAACAGLTAPSMMSPPGAVSFERPESIAIKAVPRGAAAHGGSGPAKQASDVRHEAHQQEASSWQAGLFRSLSDVEPSRVPLRPRPNQDPTQGFVSIGPTPGPGTGPAIGNGSGSGVSVGSGTAEAGASSLCTLAGGSSSQIKGKKLFEGRLELNEVPASACLIDDTPSEKHVGGAGGGGGDSAVGRRVAGCKVERAGGLQVDSREEGAEGLGGPELQLGLAIGPRESEEGAVGKAHAGTEGDAPFLFPAQRTSSTGQEMRRESPAAVVGDL